MSLRTLALWTVASDSKTGVVLWAVTGTCPLLVPAKILSTHLVETVVEGSVEVPESLEDLRGDLGMRSAFRLSKTARPAAPLGLLQTGESFGLIEIEVLV